MRTSETPVEATDPGDVLTYTLGGTNAAQFDLDRSDGPAEDEGSPWTLRTLRLAAPRGRWR